LRQSRRVGSRQNRWIGKDCPVALWAAGLFLLFELNGTLIVGRTKVGGGDRSPTLFNFISKLHF
jgi:hypothetical protein